MIFQKLSINREKEFLKVRKIIHNSDAAFTNFETLIRNNKGFPRYKVTPSVWMTSPRFVLDELKWMGFNLFSLANNHSMDYSEEGLIENLKVFEDSRIVHAGTGRNLSEARAPAYLDTGKSKVALIAINTRGVDSPASEVWGNVSARPGINPLRFTTTIFVKKIEFDQLKVIFKELGFSIPEENELNFMGNKFVMGNKADIHTTPYKPDMNGNLRSIKEARKNADFVLVSLHNHEKLRPGASYFDDEIEYIAKYVETFSRASIDAGADAVIGHGTHCLNGIEIYKGHPIFYGLGNFVSQPHQNNPKPYDWYEARGLNEMPPPFAASQKHLSRNPILDSERLRARAIPLSQNSLQSEANKRKIRRLYTSVIAKNVFEKNKLKQVFLYPIELNRQNSQVGTPFLASYSNAYEILNRLSKLSANYGTKITIKKGIGKIIF